MLSRLEALQVRVDLRPVIRVCRGSRVAEADQSRLEAVAGYAARRVPFEEAVLAVASTLVVLTLIVLTLDDGLEISLKLAPFLRRHQIIILLVHDELL